MFEVHSTWISLQCCGTPKISTLTEASEEIARLKQKVQQLETELKQRATDRHNIPIPAGSMTPLLNQAPVSMGNDSESIPKKHYDGVHFRPTRSSNDTWFGPSSLYSFIHRLAAFLDFKLQEEHPVHQLHPVSASDHKLLNMPEASLLGHTRRSWAPLAEDVPSAGVYLSLVQEDYFINLFWQTYHTSLFAIVDETQFKTHYQSLLVGGGEDRKPSALVDIIIAMCMQYATSTMPTETQGVLVEGKDALVAGRWHYWRGQKLLACELDSPSLSTLQYHLLCAVYICGGSFHNMIDSTVGLAVRTAYMLGLHIDPPPTMPEKDREMRRRLWWAVYLTDSKAGMKLGRPFMVSTSYSMPHLPGDTHEAAAGSGSILAPLGQNATWLSYTLLSVQLYMKARDAYTAFYDQDIHLREGGTLWATYEAQNFSASVLKAHTQSLHEWIAGIPEPLKLKRQNNGHSMSTDFTSVLLEPFTPPWLQRQRLLLEQTYHHLSLNLYRPFLAFSMKPLAESIAEELAMRCASHAIMLTMITHQALTESSLLDGWHEAFYCQWNAVMTIVGFVTLFPHSAITKHANDAIELAILVFDNFGVKFLVPANAARIVRDLYANIEAFAKPSQPNCNAAIVPEDFSSSSVSVGHALSSQNLYGAPLFNLLDMAVDLDFWNSVDTLWPNLDMLSYE
ncbi:hypothetical protein CNMCM6457_001935 [Aspergillus fumigatiaffinis]|nr:hypothetical protein CNMCM6457_001935 [Aspergillus fumigatiaffinis]